MNLTIVEISNKNYTFLTAWIDSRLFLSDCVEEWLQGFESGLEYTNTNYEKNFYCYQTENNEVLDQLCSVTRATSLEDYITKIEGMGLERIEK